MSVVVIVGTKKGALLLRSQDAREQWDMEGLALPGWEISAATRDAGGRTYLGMAHEVFGTAVAVSDDLHEWRQIEKGPRYAPEDQGNPAHNLTIGRPGKNRHLDSIWKLTAHGDTVYAGVSEAGLFRSDDRGESWQPIEALNGHPDRGSWVPGFGGLCTHSVLVHPERPERLWIGISAAGCFRSDDGGKTWAPKNDGVYEAGAGYCVHGLALAPDDPSRIYRQDHTGVYRSIDAGDSWQVIETGLPEGSIHGGTHKGSFGFPIALDPHTGAAYVVPLAGDGERIPFDGALRVYRSRDGGERWEAVTEGLPQQHVYTSILRGALAVDGLDPCGVYFGTSSGNVYASRDRGESWTQLPCSLPRIVCVEAFRV